MSEPGISTGATQPDQPTLRHVLACIDTPSFAEAILAQAVAVAEAIGARITVMHVLESPAAQEPMDPVEWALRRRDTAARLREHKSRIGDLCADSVIVVGQPAERISAWAHDNAVDLIVLGRDGESDGPFVRLGDTARRVAEVANASVLLVPPMPLGDRSIHYRKVLVPLDGSSRSECALPLGLTIATAQKAEMLLVHAAPKVDLIESDLLEVEAVTLRDQLYRRNERAARQYLDCIRSRFPAAPTIRTRLLPSGDARRALAITAAEEGADLMVLSSAGKGGHADTTVGSVASYLINHINIPILLVRQHKVHPSIIRSKPDHAMDEKPSGEGIL